MTIPMITDNIQAPPIARGDYPLLDRGSEAFVERITVGTDAIDLRFAVDCKEVYIYNEGASDLTITGLDMDGDPLAGAVVDLSDTAVVDNGDASMNVTTLINHGFTVGDNVYISGRSGDAVLGTFAVLPTSATDQLVLLANWTVNLTTTPGVDSGGGLVTLETAGNHHIAIGGFVTIDGRSDAAYAGTYTTQAGTATDQLVITAVYVDESAGVAAGGTVVGVYDEAAGVAVAGDAAGIHSTVLVASSGITLPIVRPARSKFLRVVSAGSSTLDIVAFR
jgi:hypothetical protein